MNDRPDITIRLVRQIGDIAAEAWDGCANPATALPDCDVPTNPFLSYAFLSALEDSGSVSAETGWAPHHLVAEDAAGTLLGAVPLYLKNHSQGEYVFDHSWAHAFERAGGNYYPKLQASIPFTPATGRRLLVRPGPAAGEVEAGLIGAAAQIAENSGVSSVHFTFLTEPEWQRLGRAGYLLRTDQQFHWVNDGYGSFDDFLQSLASRKRKQLRRERREAVAAGIEIKIHTGSTLTEADWDAFYLFYTDTGMRKWGRPYLNREFFSLIGERMADQIALVLCYRDGRPIAGALNFIGSDTLFGRNWGCTEHHPFLHFEACYYQAIDFAIARGLKRVEAGAQGAHKLARGYLPTLTYSAHWITDPRFRAAVEDFLEQERRMVEEDKRQLDAHSPFRHTDHDGEPEK